MQLEQVILNLVMNAIESMSSAAESRVLSLKSESTEHNTVLVSIADTGSGIDIANLNRVFQPMFTTKARGREWVFRSVSRLSRATMAASGCRLAYPEVRFFILNCRCTNPANVNLIRVTACQRRLAAQRLNPSLANEEIK